MKNIYIVKLNLNGKTYYKVGQTDSGKVKARFDAFRKYKYEVVKTWELNDDLCLYLELLVHKNFKHVSLVFPENICGKTEFYSEVGDIVNFIQERKGMRVEVGHASKNCKGVSVIFKKSANKIQQHLNAKTKDLEISYKVIGFWIYNYTFAKSNGYTHLIFRMGMSGDCCVKFTEQSALVKWTKRLGDLGFLEIVVGSGYTPSYITFTEKFKNCVDFRNDMFRSLVKSDMSEEHRKYFYPE